MDGAGFPLHLHNRLAVRPVLCAQDCRGCDLGTGRPAAQRRACATVAAAVCLDPVVVRRDDGDAEPGVGHPRICRADRLRSAQHCARLAIREILADFFSGIILNLEGPFRSDEFIRIHQRGYKDPVVGFAREITFRSTRIITPENNLVILPNSAVTTATIDNLGSPTSLGELDLEIVLDWDVNLAVSDMVLGAALVETWAAGVTHGSKPPKARIRKIDGSGLIYKSTTCSTAESRQ